MEVPGAIARQLPCFSSAAAGGGGCGGGLGDQTRFGVSFGPKRSMMTSGFRDKGHLKYYYGDFHDGLVVRCGGKKEKQKDMETSSSSTKKKLKLLKELSKDFSMFSPPRTNSLVEDVQANFISEATEVLVKQLEQLRAEEKEIKRRNKEEKAKLKAAKMKTRLDCESSSSSSESSDSECGEVIDMSRLRNEAVMEQAIGELQQSNLEQPTAVLPVLPTQESIATEINGFLSRSLGNPEVECCGRTTSRFSCNGTNSAMISGTSGKRIEVCMGNKCKKSGGAALLEEIERAVGMEGAVVGCKCMGKCRDGPNVRVVNSVNEGIDDSVRTPVNPLCIGVGLEDVGVIVANFLGKYLIAGPATELVGV